MEGLFSLDTLLMIPIGVVVGIVFGILPGFNGSVGMAICMPIAITMTPLNAMVFLINLYNGAMYGGGIPAILVGTPGTAGGAATVLDGFEMAKKGRAIEALEIQAVSSTFGSAISVIAFLICAPALAKFGLKFGPPEFFVLAIFGLSILASMDTRRTLKTLFAGALGIALSTIGCDPIFGTTRMSLGNLYLYEGLPMIACMLGLFCITRMLLMANDKSITSENAVVTKADKTSYSGILEPFRHWGTLLKGTFIGVFVGALPGAGAAISSFMAYTQVKNSSMEPEKFGTGIPEGVIAPEASNNATLGGALVPTFTLGIPGSGATAVLLSVMMYLGLRPGPRLFLEQWPLIKSLGITLLIGCICLSIFGVLMAKRMAIITKVPLKILGPIVIATSTLGAFSERYALFDIGLMFFMGALGVLMEKLDYPVTATVLGLVLGDLAEESFLQSLRMSSGSSGIFFTRPITIVLWALTVISLLFPILITKSRESKKAVNAQ